METGTALRETSDALLRDLDVLVTIEEEKRSLEPGDPRLVELAARVEEIARRVLAGTARQHDLTKVANARSRPARQTRRTRRSRPRPARSRPSSPTGATPSGERAPPSRAPRRPPRRTPSSAASATSTAGRTSRPATARPGPCRHRRWRPCRAILPERPPRRPSAPNRAGPSLVSARVGSRAPPPTLTTRRRKA